MSKRLAIVLALAAVATLAAVTVLRSGKSGEISDLVVKTLRGSNSTDKNLTSLYESWKKENNKTYGGAESQKRFGVFVANYKAYEKINSEKRNFTLGINQFSDLTQQEFASIYLNRKANPAVKPSNEIIRRLNKTLKDGSLDWRTKGAVTPVKDQGNCGSCWAHSTIGSLEGLNAITNGKLVVLSEQQLVDCSGSYGNAGCNGGMNTNALKYTAANGIATNASYPYKARDGKCTYTQSQQAFRNKGYQPANSDKALEAALNKTPVAVAVAAGNSYFQGYKSGVLDAVKCGTSLDHEITGVGYGADQNGGFWILKNSWTTKWGESGYIRIARTTGNGICGMYMDNAYPTL